MSILFSAKFGGWRPLALQNRAIRESFLRENRIFTNSRKFSPSKVSRDIPVMGLCGLVVGKVIRYDMQILLQCMVCVFTPDISAMGERMVYQPTKLQSMLVFVMPMMSSFNKGKLCGSLGMSSLVPRPNFRARPADSSYFRQGRRARAKNLVSGDETKERAEACIEH